MQMLLRQLQKYWDYFIWIKNRDRTNKSW